MSIAVLCPKCQKKLNAPDSLAGRRAKCPHCAQVMQLPAPQPKPRLQPQLQEAFAELGSTNPLGMTGASVSLGTQPSPNATSAPATGGGLGLGGLFDEQQFDEMLADVGTRIDKPHESKENRYPCPVCHEMIVRGSRKCRFCGEDFEKEFNALLPNKGRSSGSREFRTKMNTLGSIWIALPSIPLFFFIIGFFVCAASNDPKVQIGAPICLVCSLLPLFWITLGIATLRKAIWAVWLGLILNYIGLILSVIITLVNLFTMPFNILLYIGPAIGLAIQIAIMKLAHRCIELKHQRR